MSDKMDKEALLTDLGNRFRALRKELNWTQQRLSARAKVSRDTIHRLEHGEVVDASSLTRLLNAMGRRISFEQKPALRAADMRRLFPEVHEDDS
ncbi:MAG: helix-turn-helix transcriptional regulator [Archangium sp.]|nr:helix-turn-helix transcriptional regulator [Archangium sp.]MDP3151158.1 helix-turn-helix transcriptional regulator [Archangium sp.]MDP3570201.1 helix-turn-helix transcriptional regulator [Archangium sp.]